MKLILDSGAFIALERGDQLVWSMYRSARMNDRPVVTHGGVVGQVWRGRGARQALLASALGGARILPLDAMLGRAAGELLHIAKQRDVIDAALVLLASDGDEIMTSDPGDIALLARVARRSVDVIAI